MGGQGAGNASAHVSAWCRRVEAANAPSRCPRRAVGWQGGFITRTGAPASTTTGGAPADARNFSLDCSISATHGALQGSSLSACFLHRAPPLIETLPSLPPWRAPPRPPSFCPAQPCPTGAATAHAWHAVAVGSSVCEQSLSGARPRRGRGAARPNRASTRCPLASRARAVQWRGRVATSPTVPL